MSKINECENFFDDNVDQIRKGYIGESIIREFLKKKKYPFMQVDVAFKFNNQWYLGEIKSQEKYLSPPFDGHGLPEWQINRRLEFQRETGVIAYLIVNDTQDNIIYAQRMDELMKTNYFKTKGAKPRIIFELKHFLIIE
jgi:hypothetical protein